MDGRGNTGLERIAGSRQRVSRRRASRQDTNAIEQTEAGHQSLLRSAGASEAIPPILDDVNRTMFLRQRLSAALGRLVDRLTDIEIRPLQRLG